VIALLAEVFDVLKELPSSPHVRELLGRATSYELAVRRWESAPPSAAQRSALFDLVTELHAKTTEAQRASRKSTAPPRTSRPPSVSPKRGR
jgi:hypothetical protein